MANVIPNQYIYMSDPVAFAAARLHFSPDPAQARVLATTEPRVILCCSRQWGKSTTTAAMAVHNAFFQSESLILITAPTGRQSSELQRKCEAFLRPLNIKPRGDGYNPHSLLFPNGSRIVALPNAEENIRGFSAPSLILIDEAARVPDALYHALLPMLAASPNGRLCLLSTPNGKLGFFCKEWHDNDNGFFRLSVTARDCPRISSTFLSQEARRLPPHIFQQEYLCQFHSNSNTMFPDHLLQAAFDRTIPPL